MALYKYPTLKITPYLGSPENDLTIDQIHELLLDEENEKLKTSALVTFPKAYEFVIDHYQGYDETDLAQYWIMQFYEKFPQDVYAKLFYCDSLGHYDESLKGMTEVEAIFKEEIDLLVHDKQNDRIYTDKAYAQLIRWLTMYFVDNDQIDKAKELFKCANGTSNLQLIRDIAFFVRKKDRHVLYEIYEDEELMMRCSAMLQRLDEDSVSSPTLSITYTLLNKDPYKLIDDDVSELRSIADLGTLKRELKWVLNCGVVRLYHLEERKSFEFVYNVLYTAAHLRLYNIIELVIDFILILPEHAVDDFLGDIGMELLIQPLSIFAVHKPEFLTMVIAESHLQDYYKSIFFDVLCYTYRLTNDNVVEKEIEKLWAFAVEKNNGLLGYFVGGIVDHEIDGYDKEISRVYEKDLIDLRYFDKREDFKPLEFMRAYYAPSIAETDFNSILQNHKLGIEKVNKNTSDNLEDEIDAIIADAIIYDEHKTREFEYEMANLTDDFIEDDYELSSFQRSPQPIVRLGEKVGRNDPCPCGSGKKYKKCCLNMN